MRDAALPVTLIVVGAIWLVWYLGWLPDKDWVIGLGFIAGGVAVLAIEGFTRTSVVTGRLCSTSSSPATTAHSTSWGPSNSRAR